MKSPSKLVAGGLLLAGMSIAQDTSKDKQPATNSAVSKPGASAHSTVSKKKSASDEDNPILSEQDKRGYALGVDLGWDVANHGFSRSSSTSSIVWSITHQLN
jgi:aconitase B